MVSVRRGKTQGNPCQRSGRGPDYDIGKTVMTRSFVCWPFLSYGSVGLFVALVAAHTEQRLILLYTSDTRNFLEPCGCRQSGLGGLPRRATVIERIRREHPHVLLLDGGNWGDDARRRPVIVQAMAGMRYDLCALGELELNSQEALALADEHRLRRVATTRRPESLPARIESSAEFTVGGRRIGILGLLPAGNAGAREVANELGPLLARLAGRCDLIVALSQQGLTADEALARELAAREASPDDRKEASGPRQPAGTAVRAAIDVIIPNSTAESLPAPITRGRTLIVPTSSKGQQLGRLDLDFAVTPPRITHQSISLESSIPDEPNVAAIVGEYFEAETARLLAGGSDSGQERFEAIDVHARYVRSEQCADCHEKAYAQWQKSKHARGLLTLMERNRLAPQCLKCHSEHYRRTGRLLTTADRKNGREGEGESGRVGEREKGSAGEGANRFAVSFKPQAVVDGIACTTCHGDGVIHSLTESKKHTKRKVAETFCKSCHDKENDDRFHYKKDLETIRHW